MKKLTLKQHWLIGTITMGLGLAISTYDILTHMMEWRWGYMITAAVLVVAGYIYHMIFVKCPFCGARLPSTTKFPEKCTVCNKSLAEYNK